MRNGKGCVLAFWRRYVFFTLQIVIITACFFFTRYVPIVEFLIDSFNESIEKIEEDVELVSLVLISKFDGPENQWKRKMEARSRGYATNASSSRSNDGRFISRGANVFYNTASGKCSRQAESASELMVTISPSLGISCVVIVLGLLSCLGL